MEGLETAQTRAVLADGSGVLVRHIPHRVASTTAAVDRESIAKRPCFLCRENLFPEQEGLAFGPDFSLYCNPFPVVDRHLTVVHREHRPQELDGQLGTILELAVALPGFFTLYNGPRCGASAPDHLHLQAGSTDGLAIVRETAGRPGPAIEAYGVRALLFRSADRSRVAGETARALEVLSSVTGRGPEPWCNVVAFHDEAAATSLVLFPRSRHRPDAFHAGELTVSPAAIDMGGILVTPFARDFERLTGEDVAAVYREVTIPREQFLDVVARLESGR